MAEQKLKYLTAEQVNFFHENGYLVIERFWDEGVVEHLKDTINYIIDNLDLTESKHIFAPKKDDKVRDTDDYFLSSGRAIRYFWEEKAWQDGELVVPRRDAINKIGHGLHDLDPDFQKVSYDCRIGKVCNDLGMEIPLNVQSMYIFKHAKIGGEVIPHQDGAFLYTEPQTCIGFWWAFDDCTTSNGCLWAVPGSHKLGVHRRFRRRDPPAVGTEFQPLEPVTWDISNAVPLVIPKGSLVLIHAAVVHFSEANVSDKPRHAYSLHIVDGREGVVYPADNWLQRPPEYPFNVIPSQ